ncbi:4-hydroxy-tetrahydrodipicolinate synthase [Streptacidiphilus sp. MAP12-33]|uniref:4-hydroxy-tetrahydrodipicolinate synthase n=1 Tax=Streptacidiphilus sp. MAP12-33 TaxID=3156266 RepID=UPI003517112F
MNDTTPQEPLPLGRCLAAMVTPFRHDGTLDTEGAQKLSAHLADSGCDGLVLSGTTGESPTTTDTEKEQLIRSVVEAVGGRVKVIAGVGTSDTAHTATLARAAERAGADGLLVVTPYYSRPQQEGVRRHLSAVADAVSLPVMLYDIPHRTGTRLSAETLRTLAEHPRIIAVKDVSYELAAVARTIAETGLHYYCGADELNLPLLAIGAVGVVSTVANVAPRQTLAVLDAHARGANTEALRLHQRLLPLVQTMMDEAPGTVTAKALLTDAGLPAGPVRPPLVEAGQGLLDRLRTALQDAGSSR